ncbi:hypothetical protein PR002_g6112 [Phytophthora rubi]|uniref:Uncharacterized protein n=1 Tax=Phytophthora rubi TaxID=129364 RepID=A0A6A3MYM4_9STRA|nr:hypothetical protein PR002_g6112 [Phytophthora rubi]
MASFERGASAVKAPTKPQEGRTTAPRSPKAIQLLSPRKARQGIPHSITALSPRGGPRETDPHSPSL